MTRIAELAAKCVHDEPVCEALIEGLGRQGSCLSQVKQMAYESDTRKALEVLRELYKSGVSENLSYCIEAAIAETDPKAYGLLSAKCGPVISILNLENPAQYALKNTRALGIRFRVKQLEKVMLTPRLVLENEETKETTVIDLPTTMFGSVPVSGSGSYVVTIPASAKPGKYRLYYRYEQDGQVVSIGHYFQVTVPPWSGEPAF